MTTREPSINRVHQFKDTWRWPEDVERFIREQCEEKTLHVCAGDSDLGDISVDADPERNADIVGDMLNLPFQECSFDTVICDPPWKSVNIFDRHGLFYELVKATKVGGTIIHNATWVPESNQCEKVAEYRRQDISFGDASVIAIYQRYPGQQKISEY